MPSLANFTIKKADTTTDVVHTGTSPASGSVPAVWYAPAVGATAETRPEWRWSSKPNGSDGERKVTGTYMYPYSVISTDTGVTTVRKRLILKIEAVFCPLVPTAVSDEFIAQGFNAMAVTVLRNQVKEGFAAS